MRARRLGSQADGIAAVTAAGLSGAGFPACPGSALETAKVAAFGTGTVLFEPEVESLATLIAEATGGASRSRVVVCSPSLAFLGDGLSQDSIAIAQGTVAVQLEVVACGDPRFGIQLWGYRIPDCGFLEDNSRRDVSLRLPLLLSCIDGRQDINSMPCASGVPKAVLSAVKPMLWDRRVALR